MPSLQLVPVSAAVTGLPYSVVSLLGSRLANREVTASPVPWASRYYFPPKALITVGTLYEREAYRGKVPSRAVGTGSSPPPRALNQCPNEGVDRLHTPCSPR